MGPFRAVLLPRWPVAGAAQLLPSQAAPALSRDRINSRRGR
jgi:hypothetical protein